MKKTAARRPSTSVPTIRRSETAETTRPKREIHPPPPKDLPYADAPKHKRSARKSSKSDDGSAEQLRYCGKILSEFLTKKQYASVAAPFYEPVGACLRCETFSFGLTRAALDWVKLNLPAYPKIIKKPMDLSTMKKKLDENEYSQADKFFDDFSLMIRNCMAFNPVGTAVNIAGAELQRLFEEKWRSLPQPRIVSDVEEDDDEDEEDDEEDRQREYPASSRVLSC